MAADEPAPPLAGPVVVDASVVVEYLVVLRHTEPATRLFHRVARGGIELWAPDLVYPECLSALRKLERLGAISPADAERAAGHLAELPIVAAGTAPLLPRVWRLREFLTPYDACYVALAAELDAVFVTAEAALARELRRRGIRALSLGGL